VFLSKISDMIDHCSTLIPQFPSFVKPFLGKSESYRWWLLVEIRALGVVEHDGVLLNSLEIQNSSLGKMKMKNERDEEL
jgi:hypothetical protein